MNSYSCLRALIILFYFIATPHQMLMNLYVVYTYVDYSEESAIIIVMCAFGALSVKSVSRTQLMSAGRFFLKGEQRKWVPKADKQQLINMLAPCFVQSGIVVVKEGADINNLSTNDVIKEGTF